MNILNEIQWKYGRNMSHFSWTKLISINFYKFLFISLLLISYLLSPICLHSQQLVERVLTLDESIRLALSNSQQLLSTEQDMKIAKQRLKEARSIMYPQLSFDANWSRFNAESPLLLSPPLGSTILPQKTSSDVDEIKNYYTTKISLTQVIWRGAKFSATKKFADAELKASVSDYEAIKNRTISSAKTAFYELRAIQKKIDICKTIIKTLSDKKSGRLSDKNRYITERILEKIKTTEEKTKKDFEIAKINYLEAIGIEYNTIFVVKGEMEYKKTEVDLNKCLAWALEYRPELKKTELQEQMDALSVNLSLSGRYPTIAVGGNYQLEDTQWAFGKKSWNATVSVTLPLFDGFGQFARIKQKKYQYRKAQINRASITDSIKAEVRKSFIEYEYAVKQFEQKQKSRGTELLSTDEEEMLKKLPYTDCIEMSEMIVNSQLDYIDSIRDVIIAKIELENAVGRPLE